MRFALVILSLLAMVLLGGCRNREKEAARIDEYVKKSLTATTYNYTKNGLYGIRIRLTSAPFKIDEAAAGGSVLPTNADTVELDNGEKILAASGACCFVWDLPLNKPSSVRVVWSEVYDIGLFNGEASKHYDERGSRAAQPGSRWCQAIVEVPAFQGAERPSGLYLHFLPDGLIHAELGGALVPPLRSEVVHQHRTGPSPAQRCREEIENPWYGIPRQPHRE